MDKPRRLTVAQAVALIGAAGLIQAVAAVLNALRHL